MLPRLGSSKLVSSWILLTIAVSLVAALDGGWLARWAALAPSRILHGEVWRLVTWPLIQPGPVALLFTCAAIFKFGGELATRWGDRRLQRFVLHVVIAAAAATVLLSSIAGATRYWHLGGWAVLDLLVIAWARQFPDRHLTLYGLVRVAGRELIYVTVGATIVFTVFLGPVAMAPELAACGFAVAYPRSWLRR